METITPCPWNNLNPSSSSSQYSVSRKNHRRHSISSCRFAEGSPGISLSASAFLPSSSLNTLPIICSLDHSYEHSSLDSVRAMHAQIIKMPKKSNSGTKMNSLLRSYMEFGDFRAATLIFFVDLAHNYLYWNIFLEEFKGLGGNPYHILEVFGELHNKGLSLGSKLLTIVLQMCANIMDLWLGLEIHACLIKRGFDLNVYSKCALMNFYGRCWGTDNVNQAFYETPNCGALLWNEAVLVHLKNEKWVEGLLMFRNMQFKFVAANSYIVAKVLQTCAKLEGLDEGKQIHAYVIRSALQSNVMICNSLIGMYSKNDSIHLARGVFDSMENPNLFSWNSMIYGYIAHGYVNDARRLFHKIETSNVKPDIMTWNSLMYGHLLHKSYQQVLEVLRRMQVAGIKPNTSSITCTLQTISEIGFLNFGKETHGYIIRNGLDNDIYVGTSLLDMYVKNDNLTTARSAFDCMRNRNVFTWNSLISGYSYKGQFEDALNMFNKMEAEGIKADLVTYNGLVSGYSMRGCIKEAVDIICQIKNSGLTTNVVSWTALISGCSQTGNHKEALEFCFQMQQEGVKPNSATVSSLLRACAGLSLLQKGKEIHCHSIRNGFTEDIFVATALIDVYVKCGSLSNAYNVFRNFENKGLASWNSMLMGLAIYNLAEEAISLFEEMVKAGVQPDAITFTALLSSCKHSGLINEGWKYFDNMRANYGIVPTIEHYSCMVDLLGRSGYLDEAWDFIQRMPLEPDAAVWGALLGSCRLHEELKLADIAAKKLFKLEPYNPANYILMMNIYSSANRWEDVERIKDRMTAVGIKSGNVWSWIQIDQKVHVFSAMGKPHPEEGEIYFELYQLIAEMKNLGYVPNIKCVYQNTDEVEKEKLLLAHTEKIAITYGLIKTEGNVPIRVIKNTKICADCHEAAKYMSLVRNREIFVKDGSRFHYFKEGKCSCNDFW